MLIKNSSKLWSYLVAFLSPGLKNKKIHPQKKFLISWEIELPGSSAKIFISKESSSYISGNGNRKRIPDISGNETFSHFNLKTSYISGSKDFFYKLNQSTLLVHANIESLLLCLFFFQLYTFTIKLVSDDAPNVF